MMLQDMNAGANNGSAEQMLPTNQGCHRGGGNLAAGFQAENTTDCKTGAGGEDDGSTDTPTKQTERHHHVEACTQIH